VLKAAESGPRGLSSAEATRRLSRTRTLHGRAHEVGWLRTLARQFTSPIVLILVVATVISIAVGDVTDGIIILAIILASGLLGFVQDFRAGREVSALLSRVQVTTTVLRDGRPDHVPIREVVPGDVVVLAAGDVIAADCRLLTTNDLLVDESVLTGESFPVEKDSGATVPADAGPAERPTMVFFGTHVASGSGQAVAVGTRTDTQLGRITADLRRKVPVTAYEHGITRFGRLLVWLMLALTGAIFVVNTLAGRPVLDALLFSLALAVGLSPQMLPAIVTISLSGGARRMAARKVIVKRLEVIEDFGSMSVLCTDKTGTLTRGEPRLTGAVDLSGAESADVLALAALNAGLQTGFVNPMDAAIVARRRPPAGVAALGEVPYDFTRRRLSVVAPADGGPVLIVKGAVPGILDCCTRADVGAAPVPMDQARSVVEDRFAELSAQGHRVLALATRPWEGPVTHGRVNPGPDDERGLTLRGLLVFDDPVKDDAPAAVAALDDLGVSLRLITGDHLLAARAVARAVGLPSEHVLTGPDIAGMDDTRLAEAVRRVQVFAEIDPDGKQRIVRALRADGTGVGFLGDGINDAPALHTADVGISVDTAVDVAKQAAAVVLLEKDLAVVIDGVRLGRRTFANTRKYTRLTTSANFGNVLSMAVASLFLPFLPLLPMQILLLNFLSDIPSLAIAGDSVDPEQTLRPASWNIVDDRRFLLLFGAVSTIFDLVTFALLIRAFDVDAVQFRTAWFIESTLTELLVLFSLRTPRPMLRSRPAGILVVLSGLVAATVFAIPFIDPLAHVLGLARPRGEVMVAVLVVAICYVAVNELAKAGWVRRAAISNRVT